VASLGADGWMDSAFLGAAGIPTVIFGPDVEWVDLVSATRTVDALLGIIVEFCA
jgi:acetylornithine deacetylase